MKDRRLPPFCYQTLTALDVLRARFDGRDEKEGGKLSLVTAVGIYATLTEVANEKRTRDGFAVSQGEIARRLRTTRPTVCRYMQAFVEAGVLESEHAHAADGSRDKNRYSLVEPESPEATGGVLAEDAAKVVSDDSTTQEGKNDSLRSSLTALRAHADQSNDLGKTVLDLLADVAEVKKPKVKFKVETLVEACRKYKDRDLAAEAESFKFWYLEGNGMNAPFDSLTGRWNTWLRHAPPTSARSRAVRRRGRQDEERAERLRKDLEAIAKIERGEA